MFGLCWLLTFFALTFPSNDASPPNQEPPVWPEEFAASGLITHNGKTLLSFRLYHSKSKQADRYELIGPNIATTIFNVENEEVGISMTNGACYILEETENPYGNHYLLPDLKGFKLHKNVGVYLDGSLVQDWRDPEGNYGAYVERKGIYGIPKAIWGPKSTSNFTNFLQPYSPRCKDFDYTPYIDNCQGPPVRHTFKCFD